MLNSFPRSISSDKTSYKYIDIKPEWVVHEGYLEYLNGGNIFKSSLFKQYFVVLTCFFNENSIGLYLYSEKTKNPSKYFQLDKNDQLNDHCRKFIEGKPGLYFLELIIQKTNKGEIFGAKSVSERKLWIDKFDQAISRFKSKPITRSVSAAHSSRFNECSVSGIFAAKTYFDFILLFQCLFFCLSLDDSNHYLQPTQSLPAYQSYTETIHDYEEAKPNIMLWENIFYNNQNNDAASILSNINQTGTFLVRPQSKKTASSNHDYTLCVFDTNHIYKFEIRQSPDHRYLLIHRDNEPSFVDIAELCEYYVTHPLRVTLNDGSNKHIYLTFPYKNQNLYF